MNSNDDTKTAPTTTVAVPRRLCGLSAEMLPAEMAARITERTGVELSAPEELGQPTDSALELLALQALVAEWSAAEKAWDTERFADEDLRRRSAARRADAQAALHATEAARAPRRATHIFVLSDGTRVPVRVDTRGSAHGTHPWHAYTEEGATESGVEFATANAPDRRWVLRDTGTPLTLVYVFRLRNSPTP